MWFEFAKMFGLELNKIYRVRDKYVYQIPEEYTQYIDKSHYTYEIKITNDGMYFWNKCKNEWFEDVDTPILMLKEQIEYLGEVCDGHCN